MSLWLIVGTLLVAAVGSLVFSTLTYSLRELSRVRLADYLDRHGKSAWTDRTANNADDLVFVTAVGRLLCNTASALASVWLCEHVFASRVAQYGAGAAVAMVLGLLASVLIPNALTRHAGDAIVGLFVRPLEWMRVALLPLTKVMHATDALVVRAAGS